MPDSIDVRRLTALLRTKGEWGRPVHLPEVDSTNTEVIRRGAPWTPVLSDHQTAGRGRLGRAWQEVPGSGLAVSVLVPAVDPPGWLPLAVGLALREALAEVAGVEGVLKWPNDVQLPADDHRKVSGILCQSAGSVAAGVAVGVGVNVHHAREDLPTDRATSLRVVGARVGRTELAAALLGHLADLHSRLTAGGDQAKGVREAYRSACDTIGREVTVHLPNGDATLVRATGVDDQGQLLVEGPEGSDTVAAGDVQHIRAVGESPRPGARD